MTQSSFHKYNIRFVSSNGGAPNLSLNLWENIREMMGSKGRAKDFARGGLEKERWSSCFLTM